MATVFIPKSTTDLNTAPANTLIAGDIAHFGEGAQSVTGTLGQWSGLAGLEAINFDPRFTGNIGGGGAGSLLVDVDSSAASLINYAAGGGSLFVSAAGPSALINRIKIIGGGKCNVTGGTTLKIEMASGGLNINSSAQVNELYMSGGSASAQFITANSAFQAVTVSGGATLATERGLDGNFSGPKMTITGGQVMVARVDSSTTLPTGTGSAGSGVIEVGTGGQMDWRGGNIDTLRVFGGLVDFSNITQNITITNLVLDAAGARLSRIKSSRFFTVTITNTTTYALQNDGVFL
jgi:fermentation-respiration switch protein FrsA (DUF1100 family)